MFDSGISKAITHHVQNLRIDIEVVGHRATLVSLVGPPEQEGVIPGFGREDAAQVVQKAISGIALRAWARYS